MRVKDIMIPIVSSIEPEMSLRSVSETMKALGVDPMPVTVNGRVVGMVSGLAMQDRAAHDGLSAGSVTVAEVMDREPICCTAEQPLSDVLRHYQDEHGPDAAGTMPVIDASDNLLGIVIVGDLHRHTRDFADGKAGSAAVETADTFAEHAADPVHHASDASFPASDPPAANG